VAFLSHKEGNLMSFDPYDFKSALPIINEDSEFFPLMSSEDEAEMNNELVPFSRRGHSNYRWQG
jgi:hypothetical protein